MGTFMVISYGLFIISGLVYVVLQFILFIRLFGTQKGIDPKNGFFTGKEIQILRWATYALFLAVIFFLIEVFG